MGDLVVQQFVSADGFAADVRNEFSLFDSVDGDSSEFDRSNLAWLENVGAIVLGATTYRMFADYWPTPASENELLAPRINALPKYVFSRTLTTAPWGPHADATVEARDVRPAIQDITERTDGDIIVWGSLTLTEALFEADLVDSIRLVIVPVAIGRGRGAFPTFCGAQKLGLRDSTTFTDGLVELEYAVQRP
ncbi:MAG: dihydrofolate reductase family protein [Homoserinimonas sp.]